MGKVQETDYWVPEHVRDYLVKMGFHLPLEAMEGYIRAWHGWMAATGGFYDYRDADGFGRIYEVHRRSIHPAMRVCREWGSLLLNDKTSIVCEEQACTDWLSEYFRQTGFMPAAQNTVVRAFGLGTGAWALWVDADAGKVRVRRYDARMVLPLTWDEGGISECAFVTRAFYRGKVVDQLQMHLRGGGGLVMRSVSSPYETAASPSQPSPSPLSKDTSGASPSRGKTGSSSLSESAASSYGSWASPSQSAILLRGNRLPLSRMISGETVEFWCEGRRKPIIDGLLNRSLNCKQFRYRRQLVPKGSNAQFGRSLRASAADLKVLHDRAKRPSRRVRGNAGSESQMRRHKASSLNSGLPRWLQRE